MGNRTLGAWTHAADVLQRCGNYCWLRAQGVDPEASERTGKLVRK